MFTTENITVNSMAEKQKPHTENRNKWEIKSLLTTEDFSKKWLVFFPHSGLLLGLL